jgi:delta 1-pyrroline-5-carboxylate dehydrogenase
LVPAPKRAEILFRAGELLLERKEQYAKDMTREMGKVLAETRGDVQEAIDMTYYMAGEGRRLFGQTTPSELPNKFAMSIRQSIGVCGLITPWNFPMAIPSWKMMPALISGNTVVLKPAEDTPLSSYHLVQVLTEAGVPPGVVNLVSGDGPGAGAFGKRRRAGGQLHWFDRGRPAHRRGVRADFQALQPRDGRQEHHHRHGRCQSRSGGRWRGLGRVWHNRPAVHCGQPRRRT